VTVVADIIVRCPAYLAGDHLQLLADVVLVRPLALRLRRTVVVNDLKRRRRGHREKSCKRQNGEFHDFLLSAYKGSGDERRHENFTLKLFLEPDKGGAEIDNSENWRCCNSYGPEDAAFTSAPGGKSLGVTPCK
jgi:hypothetical protein